MSPNKKGQSNHETLETNTPVNADVTETATETQLARHIACRVNLPHYNHAVHLQNWPQKWTHAQHKLKPRQRLMSCMHVTQTQMQCMQRSLKQQPKFNWLDTCTATLMPQSGTLTAFTSTDWTAASCPARTNSQTYFQDHTSITSLIQHVTAGTQCPPCALQHDHHSSLQTASAPATSGSDFLATWWRSVSSACFLEVLCSISVDFLVLSMLPCPSDEPSWTQSVRACQHHHHIHCIHYLLFRIQRCSSCFATDAIIHFFKNTKCVLGYTQVQQQIRQLDPTTISDRSASSFSISTLEAVWVSSIFWKAPLFFSYSAWFALSSAIPPFLSQCLHHNFHGGNDATKLATAIRFWKLVSGALSRSTINYSSLTRSTPKLLRLHLQQPEWNVILLYNLAIDHKSINT